MLRELSEQEQETLVGGRRRGDDDHISELLDAVEDAAKAAAGAVMVVDGLIRMTRALERMAEKQSRRQRPSADDYWEAGKGLFEQLTGTYSIASSLA